MALKGRDDLIPFSAEATQIGVNTQNRDLIFFIAEKYADEGFDVKITTSAKNLIYSLRRDPNWIMQRYSANKKPKKETKNKKIKKITNTIRDNCKTASFYFQNR